LRGPVEWTRTFAGSLGAGGGGLSGSVSTGFRVREEKERVLRLEVDRDRAEKKQIQATRTDSVILYDTTARIAKIFVVMHLLQA
jgi:hypothetical protein